MRKKRFALYALIIIVLATAAFIFIRSRLLNTTKTNASSTIQNPTSPIDLRPAIIAKLQSLIKTGSDGLYNLSMQEIEPDIVASTVDIINAKLTPDSLALKHLDSLQQAPDDVYTISVDTLHITGINIDDLLHTSDIRLDSITVSKPVITCDHQPKPYNRLQRAKEQDETLYQKLAGQIKSAVIQSIIVRKCTYISKQKGNKQKIFNDVTMQASHLQIDSSTQYDKQRVFFSKQVNISCNNFMSRTADSLYFFKIGSIQIDATQRSLAAQQVAYIPRGSKSQFEKRLQYQDNRFNMQFPKIIARNIDWWALTNNESFTTDEVELYNATIEDYVDRRLPETGTGNIRDFPPQLLMEVPVKMNIKTLRLHKMNLSYEEFNPSSNKNGTISFNNIDGTISNISNIPAVMSKYAYTKATLKGLFMNSVLLTSNFSFDLKKSSTGNFSMQMNVDSIDKDVLNSIAEPLGLFTIKTGKVTKAGVKIKGDNYKSEVNLLMLYNDLHLIPLKKNEGNDTSMHKKTVIGFFANTFIIKNNNPAHDNDPRIINTNVNRSPSEAFFGFIWKSILTGILKTIGLPEKFGGKR